MAASEVEHRANIDDHGSGCDRRVQAYRLQELFGGGDSGTMAIDLRKAGEVGRIGPESVDQPSCEGLWVVYPEQGIRSLLCTDGGGALGAGRGGAEGSRAVRRPDADLVGQAAQ